MFFLSATHLRTHMMFFTHQMLPCQRNVLLKLARMVSCRGTKADRTLQTAAGEIRCAIRHSGHAATQSCSHEV